MVVLIGLGGHATSGKDAVADLLVARHDFYKTYMSKPLEQALLTVNPWVVVDDHTQKIERYQDLHQRVGYEISKTYPDVREYLQNLGTDVGRKMIGEEVWIDIMGLEIGEALSSGKSVVVTGIRFENERRMIKDFGGNNVWVERGLKPVNDHLSDNALTSDDFDYTVLNFLSLNDLVHMTEKMMWDLYPSLRA